MGSVVFKSLVWKGILTQSVLTYDLDYKDRADFYLCEVLSAQGSRLLVAPLYCSPVWVDAGLVQIAEDNYYELTEEREDEETNT